MEQAKRRKIEMIAGLILVIVAFLGNGHLLVHLPNNQSTLLITMILTTIALIFAGVYVGTEFKKSSAKLYKLFLYALALKQLTGVLNAIESKDPFVITFCSILAFALLNILLWGDDLGKMKSIVLSIPTLAVELYHSIHYAFISPPVGAGNATVSFEVLLAGFSNIVLPLVLVMMVHLKYVDKEMRNTK